MEYFGGQGKELGLSINVLQVFYEAMIRMCHKERSVSCSWLIVKDSWQQKEILITDVLIIKANK